MTLTVCSPAPSQETTTQTDDAWNEAIEAVDPPDTPPETEEADETPQPEEPEPAAPTYTAGQMQLLAITQERNSRLQAHPTLMASAQRLANYHASTKRWGHSSANWRPNATENIAWNSQGSISKLGVQWTNSRGHNSNWLSPRNYVGVGVAWASDGRVYGVQHFSNSPGALSSGNPYLVSNRRTTNRVASRRRWTPLKNLFRRRRR